jgi:molybdopterin converting factor small subunit
MAVLRLFAAARTAAGTARDLVPGDSVAEILASATERYGDGFAAILPTCAVWVNGEPADGSRAVDERDEVAVLPPVSGGAS